MEPVLHGGAQQLFVPKLQRLEHQCAVGDVVNGVPAVDLLRQNGTGEGGGQGEIRNENQKFPPGVQGKADAHRQTAVHHGRGQAAQESGGQIVRMAFHGVGDVEKTLGGELIAPQDVGAHGAGHQQRGGGAETPADGNVGVNVNFHAPDFLAQGTQHGAVGGVGQIVRPRVGFVAAGDLQTGIGFFKGDVGVQAQGAAEGVKPGAEVCGGGGNADGNSFHAASPVGLQMQDVVQHVFLVDDAGVAFGFALQTRQILGDGDARHGG